MGYHSNCLLCHYMFAHSYSQLVWPLYLQPTPAAPHTPSPAPVATESVASSDHKSETEEEEKRPAKKKKKVCPVPCFFLVHCSLHASLHAHNLTALPPSTAFTVYLPHLPLSLLYHLSHAQSAVLLYLLLTYNFLYLHLTSPRSLPQHGQSTRPLMAGFTTTILRQRHPVGRSRMNSRLKQRYANCTVKDCTAVPCPAPHVSAAFVFNTFPSS